jgi:putative hydrolase of the HAD superfamily
LGYAAGSVATIRGIIFDVGGVLVALDGVPSLARQLGLEGSHDEVHRLWMSCPSVQLHETGRMSVEDFAAHAVAELGLALSPDAFRRDFDGWLIGPVDGAFDIVARIPARYRVGVLSNMSARHWQKIVAMGLPDRFDFLCVSHETGLLKPSPLAFEHALRRMALPPQDVLFLDDGTANIEAARRLGISAVLVTMPDEVLAALENHGVL